MSERLRNRNSLRERISFLLLLHRCDDFKLRRSTTSLKTMQVITRCLLASESYRLSVKTINIGRLSINKTSIYQLSA